MLLFWVILLGTWIFFVKMKKKTLQSLLGQISGMTLGFRCAAGVKSQKHARMHRDRDVVGGGGVRCFPVPTKGRLSGCTVCRDVLQKWGGRVSLVVSLSNKSEEWLTAKWGSPVVSCSKNALLSGLLLSV